MANTKRPAPESAKRWMAGGQEHRPQHEARLANTPALDKPAAVAESTPDPRPGGRPKAFDGPTGRLNLQLPEELVGQIILRARREKKTPGQLVAELLKPLL
jgi:hypothetical protein